MPANVPPNVPANVPANAPANAPANVPANVPRLIVSIPRNGISVRNRIFYLPREQIPLGIHEINFRSFGQRETAPVMATHAMTCPCRRREGETEGQRFINLLDDGRHHLTIPPAPPACGFCRTGTMERGYTLLGIFCAIVLFPIGILLLIWWCKWRCNNCSYETP